MVDRVNELDDKLAKMEVLVAVLPTWKDDLVGGGCVCICAG